MAQDAPLAIDKSAPVQEEQQEDSDEIMLAHEQMEDARRMLEEGEMREQQEEEGNDDDDEVNEPSPLDEVPFPDVHDLSEDENDVVEVGADGGEDDATDSFFVVDPTRFEDESGQLLANADAAEEDADLNSEMATEGETGDSGGAGDISMSAVPEDPPIDPAAEGFKYWAGWLAQKYRYTSQHFCYDKQYFAFYHNNILIFADTVTARWIWGIPPDSCHQDTPIRRRGSRHSRSAVSPYQVTVFSPYCTTSKQGPIA